MKHFLRFVCAFVVIVMICVSVIPASAAYTISYDRKDCQTPVRNQGENNNCMYYAFMAAAECYAKIYYDDAPDFDEEALEESLDAGDDYSQIIGALPGVNLPEENSDGNTGYFIRSISKNYVDSIYGVNGSREIKEAVAKNGSAVIVFSVGSAGMNDANYYKHLEENGETVSTFYYPGSSDYDHSVIVVGWDDGFSADRFSAKPSKSGAWLCKNSYGEEYGDGGYFWLSYSQPLKSAVSLQVSYVDGNNVEDVREPESDQDLAGYIGTVYLFSGENEVPVAYGYDTEGNYIKLTTYLDYYSNCYIVRCPDNYGFDSNTVCLFDGETLESDGENYGFSTFRDESGNEYFGFLFVACKNTGGLKVKKAETSKYGMGYVRLTYDNGSERLIDQKSFENYGITYYDDIPGDSVTGLPEPGKRQKYVKLNFDKSMYTFDDSFADSLDPEKYSFDEENNDLYVLVTDFLPQINLEGMIGAMLLMFSNLFGGFSAILSVIGN